MEFLNCSHDVKTEATDVDSCPGKVGGERLEIVMLGEVRGESKTHSRKTVIYLEEIKCAEMRQSFPHQKYKLLT